MSEFELNDTQRQSFLGSIETGTYISGENRQDTSLLSAELELGDRIVIPGDSKVNPRLGKVAGQPIVATMELKGSASRERTREDRWIHLVRILEPSRSDLREIEEKARQNGFPAGDYFLASGTDANVDALAFLPRATQYGLVGEQSNLNWINYGSNEPMPSPIKSAHELVFTLTGRDVAIYSLPIHETERRSTKVILRTTATAQHRQVIEDMRLNATELKTHQPKTVGQGFLKLLRK